MNFESYIVEIGHSAKAGVRIKNDGSPNESVVMNVPFQELARQGLTFLFEKMKAKGVDVTPADIDGFFFASAISQKLFGNGDAYYALPQMLLRNAFPDLAQKGMLHAVGRSCEKACSSGGDALRQAWEMILAGDAECVVVLAVEKMCGVPNDFILGGLTDWRTKLLMAKLSETKAKELQKTFGTGFSVEDHDNWGLRSYALAKQHASEISVIPIYNPKDGSVLLDRNNVSEQYGDRLKIVASKKRNLMCILGCEINTVLNSSMYATGYSVALVASESFVKERNLTPRARIITVEEWSENRPEDFITAPWGGIQKTLRVSGLSLPQIERFEWNEAFATGPLYAKAMGISEEVMNPDGGAIADGHAIASTFLALTDKALQGMERDEQDVGMVTTCNAAEEDVTLLFERL